jgi:protein SCO1
MATCPHPVARRRIVLSAGGVALAAAALPFLSGCTRAAFQSVDVTGAGFGRDFRLSDPDGRVRTLAEFRGRVVLIFFGFTQCPDVCPTALSRAADVMNRLETDAQKVQVIFVTVDPERDTPALLREYTHAFHPSFLGLQADLDTTAATAREFKVFYKKVPTASSYTMDHTAITYAFDPQGHLRLAIKHDQTAESIAADVRLLLDRK